MHRSFSIAAAALALCDAASATTTRHYHSRDSGKTVALDLWQLPDRTAYLANISVGTPPQQVTVQIDTGSSDLWVYAKDVKCKVDDNGCLGGTFDQSKSSSFKNIGTNLFNSSYGDGSTSAGDYITETIQLGNSQVKNMTIGLAHSAISDLPFYGIMGIDFPIGEFVLSQTESEDLYYNLPYWLTAQGLINEPVYSLYLNDIDSKTSTLLFGGVDSAKYNGQLVILDVLGTPISRSGRTALEFFAVPLTAVGAVNTKGQTTSFSNQQGVIEVILDSGSTATTLPSDMVQDMYQKLGISSRSGIVPCSYANSDITIAFQFGGNNGALIGVPIAEMILPTPKSGVCEFGISAGSKGGYILGDTFLRSAYVVFDPGHAQVGIAQAKLDTTDSNVQAISAIASVPASIGTVPATLVGPGTGYGGTPLPGSTVASIATDAVTGGVIGSASGVTRGGRTTAAVTGSDATVNSGSMPTNLSGGSSIQGISTVAQSHAQAAAATSSKAAAAGLAPPSYASILAVIGGSAVMMMAGLSGAAMIFANL